MLITANYVFFQLDAIESIVIYWEWILILSIPAISTWTNSSIETTNAILNTFFHLYNMSLFNCILYCEFKVKPIFCFIVVRFVIYKSRYFYISSKLHMY